MKCYLIILVFFVGQNQASPSKLTDELNAVGNTIKDDWLYVENKVVGEMHAVTREIENACSCINYNCGCCAHLEEKEIHLNSTICVNVTYLVKDYGISITVTLNKYTLYNETVSARNPPPICIGVPYVKEFADACVRFYDIDATTTHLHACVRVEARMKTVLIAKYELGCFNVGPPGLTSEHDPVLLQASKQNNGMNTDAMVMGLVTGMCVMMVLLVGLLVWRHKKKGYIISARQVEIKYKNYGSMESLTDDKIPDGSMESLTDDKIPNC